MNCTSPVESIFFAAREKGTAEERSEFLNEACAGDEALRRRIERMLEAEAGGFLDESAAAVNQTLSERPGTIIGPYKLLEQIGEGGFGVVFMAEQTHPVQRKIALKVIKPGMDSRQVIARFEAERQALAMMDHPNIAKVFDAGATGDVGQALPDADNHQRNSQAQPDLHFGRPYFAMELVHGVPITQYCDDNRLTPRQRLELFVPVCQAIQHAHQKGIIHRDIKPTNVMVTLYDGQPVPKVIDFGVAKATEQKLTERTLFTQYGTLIGTPQYMSPEQAEMSALGVDTRSDVYSLGVLLYELLTGSTPLSQERIREAAYGEVVRMIKEEDPPTPSTRLSESGKSLASISAQRDMEAGKLTKLVRGELDWIVMKTLEKDRNHRYESASGLAADVERYLNDEPVEACPPSTVYRFQKFARKNKAALTFTGLILLILLTVTGGIGWNVRDRAVRQATVDQEAVLALKEAERWHEQAKWPEALSATKRAEGLLTGGGSGEVRERARELRKDLEMVLRLEEIPLLLIEWEDDTWDYKTADRAFAQAFADYGIDITSLPVDEAAARIRESGRSAGALVTALDAWALHQSDRDSADSWALRAVAQAADPDPWRRQVREAWKQKDGKALAVLAASQELWRQPPSSLLVLGRALHDRELPEAGVEVLRQAQRQYPGDFWISYSLGTRLNELKPPDLSGSSFLRAAVAVRPQNSAAHHNLGRALEAQGEVEEAIACYRKVIEIDSGSARGYNALGNALHEQRKHDEAIACYRKGLEVDPKSVSLHTNLGVALCRQGKFDEAVASHRKGLEVDPKHVGLHNNLGTALGRQRRLDEAIACFRTALEIDPKNVYACENLGGYLWMQKKADEGLPWVRKSIELDPEYARAHFLLGLIMNDQKKPDEAIASYRRAIELDRQKSQYYISLGNALMSTKPDEAIATFRKAVEINPKDSCPYINIGIALEPTKPDEAIAWWRKAIEIDPKNFCGHINIGIARMDQGKLNEAVAYYRKAIEIDPKSVKAHTLLGMVLMAHGNFDEASRWYRKAIELAPQSSIAWQHLGHCEYRAGNWQASIEILEKSCKLQGNGTGDVYQWIVLALGHARLAALPDLPEKEREHHHKEARRWFEPAIKELNTWRVAPDNDFGQAIWDFGVEARKLMGAQEPMRPASSPADGDPNGVPPLKK